MTGEPDKVLWRGVRPVLGIDGIWPARDSVRVAGQNLQTGVGTTVVYTVPASKKLFVYSAGLSSSLSSAVACRGYLVVRDDVDAIQYFALFQHLIVASCFTNFIPYTPAIELLAGWDLAVSSDHADLKVRGFFFGWLEDA